MANNTEKTFEEKMNRLQEIVAELEKDDIDLDLSIKLYSEGLQLSKTLKDELQSYENKVKELGEDNE